MISKATTHACRNGLLPIVCLLVLGGAAYGQIGIWVSADHKHYLRYEPVEVAVTLRNYSGNTLVFGGADGGADGGAQGGLHFLVERANGAMLKPFDKSFNPVEDLILGAGETRRLVFALNTMYDLQREGSYRIRAQIGHSRLPNDYRSDPLSLDVRDGVPIIERNIGLPASDTAGTITAIKVSLLLFHDGEQGLYCLRAEDEKTVYGTVRLGPQIIGSQPSMDADAASDVHVLIQIRARLFVYAVYSLSRKGMQLRQKQYYKPDEFGPRLTRAPGYLKIIGGTLARQGVDFEETTKDAAGP